MENAESVACWLVSSSRFSFLVNLDPALSFPRPRLVLSFPYLVSSKFQKISSISFLHATESPDLRVQNIMVKGSKSDKETTYEFRDIVLAKVRGYPPWPGMVSYVRPLWLQNSSLPPPLS